MRGPERIELQTALSTTCYWCESRERCETCGHEVPYPDLRHTMLSSPNGRRTCRVSFNAHERCLDKAADKARRDAQPRWDAMLSKPRPRQVRPKFEAWTCLGCAAVHFVLRPKDGEYGWMAKKPRDFLHEHGCKERAPVPEGGYNGYRSELRNFYARVLRRQPCPKCGKRRRIIDSDEVLGTLKRELVMTCKACGKTDEMLPPWRKQRWWNN